MSADTIPTVEIHRGVGIHDFQPVERIDGIVKPAIDAVYLISDPAGLAEYAASSLNPPEARLFAAARCEAAWELAAENRKVRPNIDMAVVKASVAGLNSLQWMSATKYTSSLDAPSKAPGDRTPRRDEVNAELMKISKGRRQDYISLER